MFIKICGITRKEDYRALIDADVNVAGFVAYPKSPRYISPENVCEIINSHSGCICKTAVFVNPQLADILPYIDAGIDTIQLHGEETPEFAAELTSHNIEVWKSIAPRDSADVDRFVNYPACLFVIDAFAPEKKGGTGQKSDWELAYYATQTLTAPVVLAGGLNVNNITAAIETVNPFGVDASSGLETHPGIKDHCKIAEFTAKVKELEMRQVG